MLDSEGSDNLLTDCKLICDVINVQVEISAHLPRPLVANEINGPGVSVTVLHGQALDTDWTSAFPQCQEFDGIGGLSATLRRLGIHVPVRARLFLR